MVEQKDSQSELYGPSDRAPTTTVLYQTNSKILYEPCQTVTVPNSVF